MNDPYFFGYGSLVNRATHDFARPQPARLTGWRRAWRHTDLRPVAFLTAVPDDACEIEGLIAQVPGADWEALDQREWAYDRVAASHAVTHPLSDPLDIAVYSVPADRHGTPTNAHPILLSYLDVVVQGYLREFGRDGVERFFATTSGWDAPILNDRAEPRYPRYQSLSAQETRCVDDHLMELSVRIITRNEVATG
ncbi:gamma-glutamylcyclotransferase family protein [Arenibacterium sp. CAU 1754]